jgi:hypothetical protein
MTYTEVNNSYFTLERSANGIDFSPITRINGTGNSKALLKYEFNDMDPLPKKNYYRLLQVDLNGASSYSNVVSATVNGSIKDIRITRVYPNPFTDRFTVDFTSPSEQQFTLMLLSVDGKIVYEQLVTAFKGNNTVLLQPAESLEKGTYTMPLVFGNEVVGASRVSHM